MKKAGTIFAICLAIIAATFGFTASANTIKPDNGNWYCVNRNGTRYCYRKGETCKLVTSKVGKYWLCDGPIKR